MPSEKSEGQGTVVLSAVPAGEKKFVRTFIISPKLIKLSLLKNARVRRALNEKPLEQGGAFPRHGRLRETVILQASPGSAGIPWIARKG